MKIRKAIILSSIILTIAIGAFAIYLIYVNFFAGNQIIDQSKNALKIPALLADTNPDTDTADFELTAQSGRTEFLSGKSTDTFGFNGSYLGPVIRVRRGEKVNITVKNKLNAPTTVHWHGLVVDGEQDGGPHQGILPGESWNPGFTVDQPAATLWFHPHIMGETANQVYYGLAGLLFIDDEVSESLTIPDDYGVDDIPLIIQDRSFKSDGNFDYRISMMGVVAGDVILINGTVNPYLNVNKGKVRFRILNASNSQNFILKLSDGSAFHQIASDGGFLESPLSRKTLELSPGERAEVIIDFTNKKQTSLSLMNGSLKIMDFNISDSAGYTNEIPETLAKIEPLPISGNPDTRIFELQNTGLTGTINGRYFDMNRIDEEVNANETEIWIIRNIGGMMTTGGHPFHVHGTQFQIISRDGSAPPSEESGFKDTVFVNIGEEVRIKIRFTHKGTYMYHCHILEHEDKGMMGQARVQ